MKSHNHLAKDFLDNKPAEAASVLEELSAPQAMALLTRVPARLVGPVLNQMLYPNAAAIARLLPADRLEAVLPLLSNTCAAAVLRGMSAAARAGQLQQLPRLRAKMLQLLLNYAETNVGAWMDTHVFTLPETAQVGQALKRLRITTQTLGQKIFVLNRQQQLVGEIPLQRLLQEREALAIEVLRQPVSDSVRARVTLESVVDHPGWGRNTELPVVDHQRRFLGVLPQATLQKALAAQEISVVTDSEYSRDGLGTILWLTLLGACQVGSRIISTDKPDG